MTDVLINTFEMAHVHVWNWLILFLPIQLFFPIIQFTEFFKLDDGQTTA